MGRFWGRIRVDFLEPQWAIFGVIFNLFFLFPNELFLGSRYRVDFDLILGSFFTFWGPNGPTLGPG